MFPSKDDNPRTRHIDRLFSSCDLDPMTLTYEHDLDILKMYLHTTKNEVYRLRLSEVKALTGQTDRCDQMHYHATFTGGN